MVVKISLRRRHVLMVKDSAFSHKIDYDSIFFLENLNIEGHPNCITGSRATAIFLNGRILPIGGVASITVLALRRRKASGGRGKLIYLLHQLITIVFVKQPQASPGSA